MMLSVRGSEEMKTDFDNIKVQIENGVAVLTMDNPPVNQLSEHFALQLMQAISEGFQDSNIKAIVSYGNRQKLCGRRRPDANIQNL